MSDAPRPALVGWAFLAVAVVGVSLSAPVTAATAAPALAVAFWRNLVGASVTGAWVLTREREGLRELGRSGTRVYGTAVLAGVVLAVHFSSWLTGLRMTSVTAATALCCSVPVWLVAYALVRGRTVPRAVLIGVALAVVGVFVITGVDAGNSRRALTGDLLSLLGAIAMAAYMLLGTRVLRTASTGVYTLVAYGSCAAVLLPVALISGERLTGFDGVTWFQLGLVTLAAQLLGHTLLNASMPIVGPTAVALTTLLEVPGAALIAWAWLGQVPPAAVIPGTVLMLAGLAVVVRSGGPDAEPPTIDVPAP